MSVAKVSLTVILMFLPFLLPGQNRNTPFSTTSNFISYRFGLGYPFFSDGNKTNEYSTKTYTYYFTNKNFNYSFHGGIELGHYFGRSFSIALSPSLMYSKFTMTDYRYEVRGGPNRLLISEWNGIMHFSNFGLLAPLEFRYEAKETFEFSAGVFVLKPFTDLEYTLTTYTDYFPPRVSGPYEEIDKNWRSFPRSGVHGQFSLLLKARDWKQSRIDIEYFHSLTAGNFYVLEKWILVAFKKVLFQ